MVTLEPTQGGGGRKVRIHGFPLPAHLYGQLQEEIVSFVVSGGDSAREGHQTV